jgi:hypothetical protein
VIRETRDLKDIAAIVPPLEAHKHLLCGGDQPEDIAKGIQDGKLFLLVGDESSFCVFEDAGHETAGIWFLFAPGLAWRLRKEFFDWLRGMGFSTLRFSTKLEDRVWTTLLPKAEKLWSVWQWDIKSLTES